ncbi:type II secretion system protein E [Sulfitobacter sp. EhC04]|uniref:CpaF family protein n=1 Tax=Sulfitobacter sp. EhC04 TaxID=1849168 RepID=UPI0007F4CB69|nr:CpaF family protein [Sulfitobacter sp. EhC04]OAN67801.1 type II secretion system protein E [Sulfitobacter sp. EhC04]
MFKSFNATSRPAKATPSSVAPAASAPAQPRPEPEKRPTARPNAGPNNGLKTELHTLLLEQLNLTVLDKVSKTDLRHEIAGLSAQYLQDRGHQMPSAAFQALMDELLDEVLGLGPLEPLLADPTISDILVNGTDKVFVERRGLLERTDVHFRDERHLLRIIDKIVSSVGRRIDESQPWVDARLEDGSRVNAIIRPCAIDGPSLSIRKFSRTPLHMEKLLEHGALSKPAALFLEAAVKGRMNILISGGTGSGKTTMLNALSAFIDPRHRMVTIEDAAELQLQQEHVVRLETRPANAEGTGRITQRDLLINALRMRPDRIMVGEVRGNEAFDMLQAMNTGHDGSMTTIHANTARDAISRLEQMVTMVGGDFPMQAVRSQVAAGLQLVLQLNRLSDGRRKVTSISEIVGLEGDTVMMQDIFVFKKMGVGDDGNVKGRMMATGVRPRCFEALMSSGVKLATDAFSMMDEVA